MKKVIRYCNECGKETREYLKVMFYESPSKVKEAKSYDLRYDCSKKKLVALEK